MVALTPRRPPRWPPQSVEEREDGPAEFKAAEEKDDKPRGGRPAAPKGNLALPGLKRLNAFDLVNQCGGIALTRMLLSQAERQASGPATRPPLLLSPYPYLYFPLFSHPVHSAWWRPSTPTLQVVKVRQFTSARPPLEVLEGIDAALQAMGCDTRLQPEAFKGKGALLSSSGMIGIIVQSYAISDTMHLVEIRRGERKIGVRW